jgi:hypothetical protein
MTSVRGRGDKRLAETGTVRRNVAAALAAAPLLFVIQGLTGALLLPPLPPVEGGFGLMAASIALSALTLTALAVALAPRGPIRAAILFLAAAGIPLNNLVEGLLFSLDIPRSVILPMIAHSIVSGALFALLLDRLAASPAARPGPFAPRRTWAWALRLAASDLAYIVLYFTAGIVVWPYVADFYAGRPMPGGLSVLLMQVPRGLVFSGIALVLMRFLSVPPAAGTALVALTLVLLGGVAPLLMPNPYMPASIRFPHMAEIAASNLLFALVSTALLRPPRAIRPAGSLAAA